jgi:sulfur-oxidizing protein SoxX
LIEAQPATTTSQEASSGSTCCACHLLSRREPICCILGPRFLEYGKRKDFRPEDAGAIFAKIWNTQSVFACSTMPRFRHTDVLTEKQVKDAVAHLFDPESPVNK